MKAITREQFRVVVTGVGLVSPVGIGTEVTWAALLRGESGIDRISLFDPAGFSCQFAGEVKSFAPEKFVDRKDVKKMGRFIQFAMTAAHFAVKQAELLVSEANAERVGVYVGSGLGALEII